MVMAGAASDFTSTTELVAQIWKLPLNRAEPKPLRKKKKKRIGLEAKKLPFP